MVIAYNYDYCLVIIVIIIGAVIIAVFLCWSHKELLIECLNSPTESIPLKQYFHVKVVQSLFCGWTHSGSEPFILVTSERRSIPQIIHVPTCTCTCACIVTQYLGLGIIMCKSVFYQVPRRTLSQSTIMLIATFISVSLLCSWTWMRRRLSQRTLLSIFPSPPPLPSGWTTTCWQTGRGSGPLSLGCMLTLHSHSSGWISPSMTSGPLTRLVRELLVHTNEDCNSQLAPQ